MNLNLRRAAPFIVVIFLAAVAFWFFWGEDSQQENGPLSASGTIEANQVVLASEIGGKVTEVLATEGELVRIDDALVKFDDKLLQQRRNPCRYSVSQQPGNHKMFNSSNSNRVVVCPSGIQNDSQWDASQITRSAGRYSPIGQNQIWFDHVK